MLIDENMLHRDIGQEQYGLGTLRKVHGCRLQIRRDLRHQITRQSALALPHGCRRDLPSHEPVPVDGQMPHCVYRDRT